MLKKKKKTNINRYKIFLFTKFYFWKIFFTDEYLLHFQIPEYLKIYTKILNFIKFYMCVFDILVLLPEILCEFPELCSIAL